MEAKLSVLDRIRLSRLLPQKGDILKMKATKYVSDKIDFSTEEREVLNLRVEDGRIVWNLGVPDTEFEFNEIERELIVSALRENDSKETLTVDDIHLWDEFFGGRK